MEHFDHLIVGGGVAGETAAETIRQNDNSSKIAIINDDPNVLYSRVSLSKPNYFLGQISNDQLWLRKTDWYEQNQIQFFRGRKAVSLDTKKKTVTLDNSEQINFNKLLIATGSQTRPLTMKGSDKEEIFYLRTLKDADKIKQAIHLDKKALIIGGGFISFEMAHLLRLAKIDTTIVMRKSYFWEPTLDATAGKMMERALAKHQVNFVRNAEVEEILGERKVTGVVLKDGRQLPCDMIIGAIGVISDLEWLKKAGIETDRGVITDEFLRTNVPNIWAAGDIAQYKDLLLEEHVQMGNWVNAHEQGRIAGLNMTGANKAFKFVSFYTTQGFDISLAFVGDVALKEGRTLVARGGIEINSYGQLILDEKGQLTGAALVNRTSEMTAISKLIAQNINVLEHLNELKDPNFPLANLLPSSGKVN